jgi:polyribonucleotide nucleotidyltransferase
MNATLAEPRDSISEFAPKIINLKIDQEKIGAVIGPGGKTIKGITEKTGATINVENDGTVTIYSREKTMAEEAEAAVRGLVQEPEVGRWYNGTVRRIMDFGAFVEFMPGKEGLVHISRMADEHVRSVHDVVEEGQEVRVKLFEIDRMGRMNLSMIENPEPRSRPSDSHRSGDSRGSGRPQRQDRSDRSGRREGRPRRG